MIKLTIIALVTLSLIVLLHLDYKNMDDIKSGKVSLVCNLPEGPQVIPPEKIVDRIDGNIYIFTNGYSKSCKVFKNGNEHL